MDIDLTDKNIVELCFDERDTSSEEADVAHSVSVLRAAGNQIHRIVGLGAVFQQLVELHLAHNALGEATNASQSTAAQASMQWAQRSLDHLCDGVAPWLKALPPSLQVLDLSYNAIDSFVQCTCSTNTTNNASSGSLVRYLRHACPLSLGLFFAKEQFPNLHRLNLSHNAIAVTLQESDAMEDVWQSVAEELPACWVSTISELDVAGNAGLASVGCFLLSTEAHGAMTALRRLSISETALDDLAALAPLGTYAPALERICLAPSPLSTALLNSPRPVLASLLEALLLPIVSAGGAQDAMLVRAMGELTRWHLDDLERALPPANPAGISSVSLPLACRMYAALVQEVAPSVEIVDGDLCVRQCREDILTAAQHVLLAQTQSSGQGFPKRQKATEPGLRGAASAVPEGLRSRIVVAAPAPDGPVVATDSKGTMMERDCFTPALLRPEDGAHYEALCREAALLESQLLESQERQRGLASATEGLTQQLKSDRELVADQGRELVRLRKARDELRTETSAQRARLGKRRREVAYGASALRSRRVALQEKKALACIEAREQAVTRREKALREHSAGPSALSVKYSHEARKNRSTLLRDAATCKRLVELGARDPYAYTPSRFKSEDGHSRGTSPLSAPETDEERYFSLYNEAAEADIQRAAREYCAQMPESQRRQLSEILGPSPRRGKEAAHSATPTELHPLPPPPPLPVSTHGRDAVPSVPSDQDLSALSLTELFEAAAAIRKKQLALKRAQESWQARPSLIDTVSPPTPPTPSPPPISSSALDAPGTAKVLPTASSTGTPFYSSSIVPDASLAGANSAKTAVATAILHVHENVETISALGVGRTIDVEGDAEGQHLAGSRTISAVGESSSLELPQQVMSVASVNRALFS